MPRMALRYAVGGVFLFQHLAEQLQGLAILVDQLKCGAELILQGVDLKHQVAVGDGMYFLGKRNRVKKAEKTKYHAG